MLSGIFFLISSVIAVFYQFHHYLEASGISPEWFGLIMGADAISSFLILPFLSPFLHGGNSRRWMCLGIIIMVASLLSYQAAESAPALIAVRISQGAGFIIAFSALTAAIVSRVPKTKSGLAFGMISINSLLPYTFIPPLMGSLGGQAFSFLTVLDYCAVITACALILLVFLKPSHDEAETAGRRELFLKDAGKNLKRRDIIVLLALNLLFYGCYAIIFYYLNEYGIQAGVENIGYFFTISNVVMISVRLMGGAFFDRFDKTLMTALCMGLLSACYLALGQTYNTLVIYIIAFFSGLGWGIAMPLLSAIMFDISEPRFRAMNINLGIVMMQGGYFIGPFTGGLTLEKAGYGPLFSLCAVISLITAGLAFLAGKRAAATDMSDAG